MEWNNFKPLELKSPEEVVEETIKGFSEATGNLVEMSVLKKSDFDKISSHLKSQFEYELIIHSKYLKGYSFTILEFGFDVPLYPASLFIDPDIYDEINKTLTFDKKRISIDNESTFKESLKIIFATNKFNTLVSGLMKIATNELSKF